MDHTDPLTVGDSIETAYLVTLFALHLESAALFAVESRKCEHAAAQMTNPMARRIFTKHSSYVTGALFAAVAYVETLINELFASAARSQPHPSQLIVDLAPADIQRLATWWTTSDGKGGLPHQREQMLPKYDKALSLIGKSNFSGETPRAPAYRQVDALRQLRNDLVHHKAEAVPASAGYMHRRDVEVELQQRHVAYDPLLGGGSSGPYPAKYFSASCACWATTTGIEFVEAFYSRLVTGGHPPAPIRVLHQRVRATLA